jgi:hypothetical protein
MRQKMAVAVTVMVVMAVMVKQGRKGERTLRRIGHQ